MKDRITKEKFERYLILTTKALEEIEKNVVKGKSKQAKEIIEMASNYLSDAKYFKDKGDIVNSFAALNYAHGWIDSGVRLGIFNVHDNKLFTVK